MLSPNAKKNIDTSILDGMELRYVLSISDSD